MNGGFAFSIVIPAYNIREYIGQALGSAVPELGSTGELIVIDDGSKDDTAAVARDLLKSVPNARVLTGENGGAGAARNKGIQAARGEYILFLDGDDLLLPGAAAKLVARAREAQADVVFSNRNLLWERNGKVKKGKKYSKQEAGPASKLFSKPGAVAIHGRLFRRDFLIGNRIEFPEGMTCEDFVFHHRVLAANPMIATLRDTTYVWRKRGGDNPSATQQELTEGGLRNRFRQIEMTQDLANSTQLRALFPKTNFGALDFDHRLMRYHVRHLPRVNEQTRARVVNQLTPFLKENWKAIAGSVLKSTASIYKAILRGEAESAIALIEMRNKNDAKTLALKKQLAQAQSKLKRQSKEKRRSKGRKSSKRKEAAG
jgi:CDP-glycerol glycerophosphotransferase